MTKKQVLALVAVASAGYAIYRASGQMRSSADEYRRRGATWDVLLCGFVATVALIAAAQQGKSAVSKLKRAF